MTNPAFRPPGARPAERYGDRPTNARRKVLLAAVGGGLALLVLAWWIWVAAVRSSPPVRYEVLGFQRISATSVEIRFSVVREPGVSIACILRARGTSGQEVGRRQVVIPADSDDRSEVSAALRTTAAAATGEVLGCEPYETQLGWPNPTDPDPSRTTVADLLP